MIRVTLNGVNYIDVLPKQSIGVLASLIQPQAPYAGTIMKAKVACDSGAVMLAKNDGVVGQVSAAEIIVRTDEITRVEGGEQSSSEMGYDIYQLQNFQRSNNDTCIHQKIVG